MQVIFYDFIKKNPTDWWDWFLYVKLYQFTHCDGGVIPFAGEGVAPSGDGVVVFDKCIKRI